MWRPLLFVLLCIVFVGGVSAALVLWRKAATVDFLTPFSDSARPQPSVVPHKEYSVYGFAPFWNLQRTTLRPELTHFAYFSLPITEAGDLDGITTEGKSVSRTRWTSKRLADTVKTLRPGQNFAIVFTQFNNSSIRKILSSPSAQLRYRASVTHLLNTSPFPISSINLDIEYNGEVTPQLRQQYVDFVKLNRQLLDERLQAGEPRVELSIDVFAGAADKLWIWDIAAIAPHVDHIVVMAFDFHRMSSSVAGPVAPIFGGKQHWNSDIHTSLKEFIAIAPPEKILLGVPFYGYEWETTSQNSRASVFPGTGSTASYNRVQELLKEADALGIEQHWDELALSPYLTFSRDNRAHVIYYEDQRSLSYKLDLVRDLQLGGIAIWALGYESESLEPWEVIREKLGTPN